MDGMGIYSLWVYFVGVCGCVRLSKSPTFTLRNLSFAKSRRLYIFCKCTYIILHFTPPKLPKHTWQFLVTFLGWLSGPFKGFMWLPTWGIKRSRWITWRIWDIFVGKPQNRENTQMTLTAGGWRRLLGVIEKDLTHQQFLPEKQQ